MTGVERIAAERARQIEVEDYSPEHDRSHVDGELARAAAAYALPEEMREREILGWTLGRYIWPERPGRRWDFKANGGRIRELEKAGALCAAEIDRLLLEEAASAVDH